jgi:DNA primase
MSLAEEVKQRIDLVDLISESVSLQKTGRNFKANCPFHNEKTPSFVVFPDRQYWQCFGACSEGGDAFTFLQKREGLDFRAALRVLAQRAGVELRSPDAPAKEDSRLDRLRSANEAAATYYHSLLMQSAAAEETRGYLATRGLDDHTIRDFQLGFAPGRGALLDHLSTRSYSSAELLEAGLCVEGENGVYDRFHDRLMFPIRDERGRVCGMGGRTLVGDAAKYLNTPQTAIFDKSGLLYALDKARHAIRKADRAVVVEGYMDVIAAHQFGYSNVVAEMGTALTEKQVGIIKRFTRNLYLALDADAAGTEATLRGIEVAAEAADQDVTPVITPAGYVRLQEQSATDIRIITIPEGKDPDELIRRDPARWEALVAEARPVIDHLLAELPRRFDLADPRRSAEAVRQVTPALMALADPIVLDTYVQRLARLVHVDESAVRALLRPAGRRYATTQKAAQRNTAPSTEPVEEYLLALLLAFPCLRGRKLDTSLLSLASSQEIYRAWLTAEESDVAALVPEELRGDLERVLSRIVPPLDDEGAIAAFDETVWKLEQLRLKRAKLISADTIAEIEAQARTNGAPLSDLMAAIAQSGDSLSDEEISEVAQQYTLDYEQGLELHQRLLARGRNRAPLTDAMKRIVHASVQHQRLEAQPHDDRELEMASNDGS